MRILTALFAACLAMTSAALAQDVPGSQEDLQFDSFAKTLNLENPGLEFTYKSGKHQGSSVGFHIAEPGHRKSGTFAPQNTSNNLESEVVSYRLARFLGISDIYNPVTYYQLGPQASARFKAILKKQYESDPDRRVNYLSTTAQLNSHPAWLKGIYRLRPRGQKFFAASLATESGHLNQSHPLASFIRANGPQPSTKPMFLSGVRGARSEFPRPSEKEVELARQLSNILLVDQLLGQWDRFFRNLEAFGHADGRLQLMARDNGGATVDDWEWHSLYDRWLSRYDRKVIQRLEDLASFLRGNDKTFASFDSPEKWKVAVGFLQVGSFNTFKRKLDLLVQKKLPELERQYGTRTYFPLQLSEVPDLESATGQPMVTPPREASAAAASVTIKTDATNGIVETPTVTPPLAPVARSAGDAVAVTPDAGISPPKAGTDAIAARRSQPVRRTYVTRPSERTPDASWKVRSPCEFPCFKTP